MTALLARMQKNLQIFHRIASKEIIQKDPEIRTWMSLGTVEGALAAWYTTGITPHAAGHEEGGKSYTNFSKLSLPL